MARLKFTAPGRTIPTKALVLQSVAPINDNSSNSEDNSSNSEDYSSNSEGPSLPPLFSKDIERQLRKGDFYEDALYWYKDELPISDVRGVDENRPRELSQILDQDQGGSPRIGLTPWVRTGLLGTGGYGAVHLWERQIGTGEDKVRSTFRSLDSFYG